MSESEIPQQDIPAELGVFPLRNSVVYPYMPQQLTASRPQSIAVIEAAERDDNLVGIFAQQDPEVEDPGPEQLYDVGAIAKIHKVWRLPDGSVRLIVQGVSRAVLGETVQRDPHLRARLEPIEDQGDPDALAVQAMCRSVHQQFQSMVKMLPHLPDELQIMVVNIDHPGRLSDFIASNLDLQLEEHQQLLEALGVEERLEYLTELLARELEILEVGNKIQTQVQEKLGKSQREYFLREQLRQIQKELSGSDPMLAEVDELREQIEAAGMSEEALEAATRELSRMEKMQQASPEYSVVRTYLDWMIDLPWAVATPDELDINEAARILDEDHHGLDKIKERVLEYLAVRTLRPEMKGPILCFVGPPGVGKTSLGQSIARALGRKFVRISLGGVHDESEIRGHRRTYVGALPGRIVQGLRKAGTHNPVFMLDEIDKLGADFRGDPAAALLEVLDPEQNDTFADHYLDVPFDLSKVVFIATANQLDAIPPALRDRLEVIQLSGYTEDEKVDIAQSHILPRQLAEHGLARRKVSVADEAVRALIRDYTQEPGLRGLEREVGRICRKIARRVVGGERGPFALSAADLESYLGSVKVHHAGREEMSEPGLVAGLAWTPFGGEVMYVEATKMKGKGGLTLTGQLGDVMRESAQIALSYIRSHAAEWGIAPDFFEAEELHVHLPAGAIPKDGPSAGVAVATALLSLLTGKVVREDVAMTGEVTLRGRVLAVGGIKEKVLAAHRAGIERVILPRRNERDLDDLPPQVRRKMDFVLADDLVDVFDACFAARCVRRAA